MPNGTYPATSRRRSSGSIVSISGSRRHPWLAERPHETSGNNVDAYADFNSPDGLSTGDFRATTTGAAHVRPHLRPRRSRRSLDQSQQMAGITSLFYVLNWLHDFWYDGGFTEVARNAQTSTTDAAARSATRSSPRRRTTRSAARATTRTCRRPTTACRRACRCSCGTGKETQLSMSPCAHARGRQPPRSARELQRDGAVVLGVDGARANINDGCTVTAASATGKIVARRSRQLHVQDKTLNAQNAGADGVIIVNNVASTPPPSLGEDARSRPDHDPVAVGDAGRGYAAQGRLGPAPSRRRCSARWASSSTARSTRR